MTTRTRRWIWAASVVIALLFIGRWTSAFVAERWWAATISPAAAKFVGDWQLLGFGLDVAAILLASLWFAMHALIAARAIASVQITRRFGDIQLRESVPTRWLLVGAVAAGVLLGLIAGAGAHAWREPLVLAWHGVSYGVTDPVLHQDLGVLVAQLPAWDLAHRFATLLAVLGLGFCMALYAGIGALRRERRTIVIHPDARRHLGLLIAFGALVVMAGYLLAPDHLAASGRTDLSPGSIVTRTHTAQVMSGLALATALLSLAWALRGGNALLLASWVILVGAAATERFLVSALVPDVSPPPSRIALLRQLDASAWGIRQAARFNPPDSTPAVTALWDAGTLAMYVERSGGLIEAATPATVADAGSAPMPAWLVASPRPGDSLRLDVLAVVDGTSASAGAPMLLRSGEQARAPRPVWRTVADARVRPAAPAWRAVAGGVDAGSLPRRVLLAWARQAPGILRPPPEMAVDWHLAPVERAAAVIPMLSWLPADLVLVGSRPTWVLQGMVVLDRFPLSTRAHWNGRLVAGVAPALLCTVDAASGETHFYVDPAADSLGVTWARIIGPVVAPAAALPRDVRGALSYAPDWLEAQVEVLEGRIWGAGRRSQAQGGASAPLVAVWVTPGVPGSQAVLDESTSGAVATIVTAYRIDAAPQLRIERHQPDAGLISSRAELRQAWNHVPGYAHLRDSVLAAGDSITVRGVRWFSGRDVVAAWQPVFAMPRRGSPTLLWIATALGNRAGGARTPLEAWLTVLAPTVAVSAGADPASRLEQAREWLRRADSAFRRGDMTAFGRAYEELRKVLAPPR